MIRRRKRGERDEDLVHVTRRFEVLREEGYGDDDSWAIAVAEMS